MIAKRKFDTVAFVGYSRLTRHLVPWEQEMEVWSINEMYKVGGLKRWDRWFQIHPYDNFMRDNNQNDPDHPAWMQEKHDFPIYCQDKYPDVPSSVRYPLDDVIQVLGRRYMTSSFSYMMGLALLLKFKRIEIYGFDMANETEYARQRPNGEWMIGLAMGRGVEVYVPPESKLLRAPLYGYEHIMTSFRQQLEFRKTALQNGWQNAKENFSYAKGYVEAFESLLNTNPELFPTLQPKIDEMKETQRKHSGEINATFGALQENAYCVENYEMFVEGTGNVKTPASQA